MAKYITGEMMGHFPERLSAKFGVSRREQGEGGREGGREGGKERLYLRHIHLIYIYASFFLFYLTELDEFAALSHQRAAKAHKDGIYKDVSTLPLSLLLTPPSLPPSPQEIIPVDGNTIENGIKGESTADTLTNLNPLSLLPSLPPVFSGNHPRGRQHDRERDQGRVYRRYPR